VHIRHRPIDEIKEEDLRELISQKDSESKYIDYKRELPKDLEKKSGTEEFLSDVTSFANAAAGHLIYGMDEDKGNPIDIVPLMLDNPDQTILRLQQKIGDGIKPRIHGVEIGEVKLSSPGCVLVIRIPRSMDAPHGVTSKVHGKFYSRDSRGKIPLDVYDLRKAFILSESIADRVRNFRTTRIEEISQYNTPVPLIHGAKLVVHVVPMDAFALAHSIDIQEIVNHKELLMPVGESRFNPLHNFDGYLVWSVGIHDDDEERPFHLSRAYTQIFRNGCIESIRVMRGVNEENPKTISGKDIERWIQEAIPSYLEILQKIRTAPPILIMVSLVEVKGYNIGATTGPLDVITSEYTTSFPPQGILRNNLLAPEVKVEDYEVNISTLLHSTFTTIWNASGWSKSPSRD
jgi:hypothetical protein